MHNLKRLKEDRGLKLDAIDAAIKLAETETRNLTSEELETISTLEGEVDSFNTQIEVIERQEKRKAELAKKNGTSITDAAAAAGGVSDTGEANEMRKIAGKFMFTRALNAAKDQKPLDGVEKELFEEARNEQPNLTGSVAIPAKFVQIVTRDLTIATEGADVRPLDMQGVVPILAPKPVVGALGAQTMSGLQGDVQFPRHNGAATLSWEGETDANAETTPTFDNLKMAPKRLGGFIDISQTFLRQASFSGEQWTRRELERVLALKIDQTAINGSGSGSEPTGILNIAGIGNADIGTNGGAVSYAKVLELLSDLDTSDALMGSLGTLTTPGVKYKLMDTSKQGSGVEGNFILNPATPKELLGYNLATSTQVPSDLTKGSGTALHPMIFGNWSDLMIGQWGGVDLLLDPYTQATNGLLRVVINAYLDLNILHPESFTAIQDIDIS